MILAVAESAGALFRPIVERTCPGTSSNHLDSFSAASRFTNLDLAEIRVVAPVAAPEQAARDALRLEPSNANACASARLRRVENRDATVPRMNDISSLSDGELLTATLDLARRSCLIEADLLVHLGEIDERKLYLDRAHSSMFAFCTRELGFSEGGAYNRILVARTARKLPAIIEAVRSGSVHLAGLRLLAPHLTPENHEHLLAKAAGRTKDEMTEIIAALAPRPPPVTTIRKLPEPRPLPLAQPRAQPPPPRPVTPVAEDVFRLQLAISRSFRDEIREAQDLLRHRIPDGDLATIFRAALGLLVTQVKKERFAVGRKPRAEAESKETKSRHVPDPIKRAVYERDGGRCTFVDDRGHPCPETGALEFDHVDGFARTHLHDVAGLRPLCRAHNQGSADKLYGRELMDSARTCPGTSAGVT